MLNPIATVTITPLDILIAILIAIVIALLFYKVCSDNLNLFIKQIVSDEKAFKALQAAEDAQKELKDARASAEHYRKLWESSHETNTRWLHTYEDLRKYWTDTLEENRRLRKMLSPFQIINDVDDDELPY